MGGNEGMKLVIGKKSENEINKPKMNSFKSSGVFLRRQR